MLGRWEVFILKVVLVAEEAMAMWIAGVVLEERLKRSSGTPGSGVQFLKSSCWALTLAVHSS